MHLCACVPGPALDLAQQHALASGLLEGSFFTFAHPDLQVIKVLFRFLYECGFAGYGDEMV